MAEDEGGGGEPLPRDSDSSAEGGHEQRHSRPATGVHLAHCGDGECLEHSVPLKRTRAMEKRNFPGFCLRAPAPTGEAVSSSFLPPAIFIAVRRQLLPGGWSVVFCASVHGPH
jgi:hypothetical protein